jgi:hypothetical protein
MGPYLLMTPVGDSKFEYYEMHSDTSVDNVNLYRAFIYSAASGSAASGSAEKAKDSNWRQKHTSISLLPNGENAVISNVYKFRWASDYEGVRRLIVENGLIDVTVIPGMTVPNDLSATFSLKTNEKVQGIEPEYPDRTDLRFIHCNGNAYIYKVKFEKFGENLLTVHYGNGKHLVLEFFVTEPIETLISKRADFIRKAQCRDNELWYNGLLCEWNMETKVLLGPDNYDRIKGWRIYEVTCDDPGLSKPSFLAAKNAEMPVQEEVEAIDYYIRHFVWGGLQRTEQEEYSYGIYGIPDWKTNRCSTDPGKKGRLHIWRIYDYPHIILMYWSMYLVARNFPHIDTYLEKEQYLERAYRTALAMFAIPVETGDWSAYHTGLYNELVIEDMINELNRAGMNEKAYRLKNHWDKKVRCFVNEKPDVFGSEYPFDSTGFESTHAFAKYALQNSSQSIDKTADKKEVILYDDAYRFMEMQMKCNIACRGWLEPSYFLLGSDYRASGNAEYTLSYMAQMGGWSILDYALHICADPYPYLRLGYASYLSSWALMNTGTEESNFGYWFPGKENDGGAGGGFEPAPYGITWLDQEHHRGSWYYSCEIDLGFTGALRCAATILADDPEFGLYCYGGDLKKLDHGMEITMKDGLRKRLHVLYNSCRMHLYIENGQISSGHPVFLGDAFSEISLIVEAPMKETSTGSEAVIDIKLSGLPEGLYNVWAGDRMLTSEDFSRERAVMIPSRQSTVPVRIVRSAGKQ